MSDTQEQDPQQLIQVLRLSIKKLQDQRNDSQDKLAEKEVQCELQSAQITQLNGQLQQAYQNIAALQPSTVSAGKKSGKAVNPAEPPIVIPADYPAKTQ